MPGEYIILSLLVAVCLLSGLHCGTEAYPTGDLQARYEATNSRSAAAHYMKEGQSKTAYSQERTNQLIKRIEKANASGAKVLGGLTCVACEVAATTLQGLIQTNASEELIVKVALDICIGLDEADSRVCHGIIPEFKDEFIGVVAEVGLGPKELCGALLGNSCAQFHNPWNENWTIPLLSTPKPKYVPPQPPKSGSPETVILHLSDIHTDSKYAPGSLNTCNEPLCCRAWFGPGTAGDYGAFNCDSPRLLVENLMEHVSKTHTDIKYIIFTGDVPAHNVWNQSRSDIVAAIDLLSSLFTKYFPNVKVYPAVGNHESAPVNSFPPPYVTGHNNHKWLLDTLAKDWARWLPESTQETIRLGGFYSVELETGLRLLSLNVNYCNPLNWWLLINNTDPVGQLAWMRDQLQDAEDKNEKVYIIGHIPPRGGCLHAWSWTYHKIVNRYSNTIRSHFFGHTHTDEVAVLYDDENNNPTEAIGTWYIGPSVTPYLGSGTYPSYRIYQKDGEYTGSSHAVLDHATYILNLTEVDITKQPVWKLEYTAKEAYGMSALNPADWDALAERVLKNASVAQQYNTYSVHSTRSEPCDAGCQRATACRMRSTRDGSPHCAAAGMLLTDEEQKRYKEHEEATLRNC